MNRLAKPKFYQYCLASGWLLTTGFMITPAYSDSLTDALTSGTAKLDMRLRYESADDSSNKEATAATLRTRLGYETGDYKDFTAYGEFEDVRIVAGLDEYAPVTSGYATVADPEVSQLNQAYIGYKGFSATGVKLGRQRLILDNARHVGNVGWRQNEQTFDALSVVNTSIAETKITYAFLDKVNGITTAFDADVSDHILNVSYSGLGAGSLTGYAIMLEDDNSNASNDTYGLRFSGKSALSEGNTLLYTAEFASQSTDSNDASYTFVEAGLKTAGITAKLGYEILGSDSGAYGFQTPLATKHAFNGWADQFLATPANGLQDLIASVGGKLAGVKLLGVYHDFAADEGGADYGSEIDLLAAKKINKHYTIGAKLASYSADSWKTDTDKLWLWGQLSI